MPSKFQKYCGEDGCRRIVQGSKKATRPADTRESKFDNECGSLRHPSVTIADTWSLIWNTFTQWEHGN
jgi:hypothetical protein